MTRLQHFLAAMCVALFTTSCMSNGEVPMLTAPPDTSIAFEPITGVPETRAAVLAEELATRAIGSGLKVVPRDGSQARFRIKGYFSAAGANRKTVLTYVWDILDSDGQRIHRISGTETVEANLPDPWQAITDGALRKVAASTIGELGDWLDRGAPESNRGTASRSGAAAASDTDPQPGHSLASALAAPERSSAIPVFVDAGRGGAPDGTVELAGAMADELAAAGIRTVAGAAEADYVVTGEASLGTIEGNSRTIAVVWSVTLPDGTSAGTVRQVTRVPTGQIESGWASAAQSAAGAAAPGVRSLIENR